MGWWRGQRSWRLLLPVVLQLLDDLALSEGGGWKWEQQPLKEGPGDGQVQFSMTGRQAVRQCREGEGGRATGEGWATYRARLARSDGPQSVKCNKQS